MNINLQDKNALIGGSSKGIGQAVAIELASLGANVTLMARSEDKLQEVLKQLDTSLGQEHDYMVVDYNNSDALKQKVAVLIQFKNIHILVNNTGGPKGGELIAASPIELVQAFHNHIVCNHILVQTVLAGMKADQYGRIINIVSTSIKEPIPNLGVSNTIRNAVANWSKTLATELGPSQITVNNVLPGFTATDRLEEIIVYRANKYKLSTKEMRKKMQESVPLQRFAASKEIAATVGFLASQSAAYITGTSITVDGGRTKSL